MNYVLIALLIFVSLYFYNYLKLYRELLESQRMVIHYLKNTRRGFQWDIEIKEDEFELIPKIRR